jgi:hypothetical protein
VSLDPKAQRLADALSLLEPLKPYYRLDPSSLRPEEQVLCRAFSKAEKEACEAAAAYLGENPP